MNNSLQTARVGLFFVMGLALIYVVYSVIGDNRLRARDGFTVDAIFDNISTLTAGADVRVAGVRVGEVQSTGLSSGKARVTLLLHNGVTIPDDSVASIAIGSLLGQNHISIGFGSSSRMLAEGDTLNTRPTRDFNAIFDQISDLGEKLSSMADNFAGFGDGSMSDLFTNLNSLVTDNRSKVDGILTNIEQLTAALNSTEGTLGRLINDDAAYNSLIATVESIQAAAEDARKTLQDAGAIIADVRSGQGTIGRLLYDDSIVKEIELAVQNLRGFTDALASGEGTLGKLVTDDELYTRLQSLLRRADEALDSVGDAGPLTVVGAAAGALF